jgi:hypothetical protein
MFDSVPMDLYPACAEEMYSDYCNKINVVLYLTVLSFCMDFGIAETGIARGSPPGTTTEVLRFGIPFAEIRVVSERPDKEDSSRQYCQHLGRSMDWGLELYEALNENGRCECGART